MGKTREQGEADPSLDPTDISPQVKNIEEKIKALDEALAPVRTRLNKGVIDVVFPNLYLSHAGTAEARVIVGQPGTGRSFSLAELARLLPEIEASEAPETSSPLFLDPALVEELSEHTGDQSVEEAAEQAISEWIARRKTERLLERRGSFSEEDLEKGRRACRGE